jgi:hypothetical protein
MEFEHLDRIYLTQDRVEQCAPKNMVMNLWVL